MEGMNNKTEAFILTCSISFTESMSFRSKAFLVYIPLRATNKLDRRPEATPTAESVPAA